MTPIPQLDEIKRAAENWEMCKPETTLALVEVIERYASHKDDCGWFKRSDNCTCGLTDNLNEITKL